MSTYFQNTNDWISQAEAARIRGISRQAISKLLKTGRIKKMEIAGKQLVFKEDVVNFKAKVPGRPAK